VSTSSHANIVEGGTVAPTEHATPIIPRFGAISSASSPGSVASYGSLQCFSPYSAASSPATTVSPAEVQTPISCSVAPAISLSGAVSPPLPTTALGKRHVRDDDERLSEAFDNGNTATLRAPTSNSQGTPSITSPLPGVLQNGNLHSVLGTTHMGKVFSSTQSTKQKSRDGKPLRKKTRRQWGNCSDCGQLSVLYLVPCNEAHCFRSDTQLLSARSALRQNVATLKILNVSGTSRIMWRK
jgi:hypothetical protein